MSRCDWGQTAKRVLRAEMVRAGVAYQELAGRLTEAGSPHTVLNLRNKVARGQFTAAFLLQCLAALRVDTIRLPSDDAGLRKAAD